MSERKARLVDCNPRWGRRSGGDASSYITFDCPEGHVGCRVSIPFTPSLDGAVMPEPNWERTGDSFDVLTLTPSIKHNSKYASREEAIAAGCVPELVTPAMLCTFHGHVTNGAITFCGDSK